MCIFIYKPYGGQEPIRVLPDWVWLTASYKETAEHLWIRILAILLVLSVRVENGTVLKIYYVLYIGMP